MVVEMYVKLAGDNMRQATTIADEITGKYNNVVSVSIEREEPPMVELLGDDGVVGSMVT